MKKITKKILHVVSSMDPVLGGVCKAVRTITTSLIANGIDNEVVSLDDPNASFISNDSFTLYALGKADNAWAYNPNLLPWLKNNLHKYDYVVIHGLWLYSSYAVNKACKAFKNTKYFVMPHGMLDPYFQKASGRRLKAFRNWFYWKIIERKVINNSHGLLFTCEEELFLARKPFKPYKPNKEIIVGLGVEEPPKYNPNMSVAFFNICKELENRPFFLFLSRIHEKKGVDILIEAYKKSIVNKSKESDIPVLVIAGPGLDTNYGKKILEMVNEDVTLNNTIFFPNMLTGDAKWGAFYNCEAFVLPSHQENFGIAVVEALACGKPVLISNQINIWKEIHQAKAGIIQEDTLKGTTGFLQDWIKMSLEKKEMMSNNAEVCFQTYYSIDSAVERWKNKVLSI